MNIHISIVCDKCLEDDHVILIKNENTGDYSITEDIDYQSRYCCDHDKLSGFKLMCPCGNSIRICI